MRPLPRLIGITFAAACCINVAAASPQTVSVGGTDYGVQGLVATGHLPAAQRDSFGETFGSGSGMVLDLHSWRRTPDGYEGTFSLLPDRGYNVAGTTDYRSRLNSVLVRLAPAAPSATVDKPDATLGLVLQGTTLLTEPNGTPLSGLDPVASRPARDGFPSLPEASNHHISLDSEAIVRLPDGSALISDEYGPYVYRFSPEGRLLSALRPPAAFIPMRNGHESFSSDNPGPGEAAPRPKNPDTGRQNNQGFEGMALSPDAKVLTVALQSATRQDGGDDPATRRYTRVLVYDVTSPDQPALKAEYVVPLPTFVNQKGQTRVAAQSELVAIGGTRYLMLCRDSGNGYGQPGATSLYRSIEVLDLAGATNIAGTDYDGIKPVAPQGKLEAGIIPASLKSFISLNDNAELARFGLHSGAPNDAANLSEKWEAMSLASVLDPAKPDDYFLFVANDNDFMTQDGFQVGAAYKDPDGADVDTRMLVYRVTLPGLTLRN